MVIHKIFPAKALVLMCFKYDIVPDDIITFIRTLIQEPEYDASYDSLVDLREANLQYNPEDIRTVIQFMATAEGFAAERKTAYITSSSNQVVPPMMMGSSSMNFPMEVKVFSSVENAIEWLDIEDFSEEDYERIRSSFP